MQNLKLYIVRRESRGIGGAEKVALRFMEAFSEYFHTEILDSDCLYRSGDAPTKPNGPGWLKAWRFARDANRYISLRGQVLCLSMERGVEGDLYRFGDGVHKVWLKKRYKYSLAWKANPLHWILPVMEKRSVIKSNWLVANSRMVASEIKSHYKIDDGSLSVIRNGFDGNTFFFAGDELRGKIKSELNIPEDGHIKMLFSGSGWKRKGLDASIASLSHLQSTGVKASLWVAGKGDSEPYRKRIDSLGLTNDVTFLGQVTEIRKWYQAADLMILPTSYDPFSNSCLEALACGCPVLTTSSNGAAEVITPENGLIVSSPGRCANEDAAKWVNRIKEMDRRKISLSVSGSLQESEIAQYLKILMKVSEKSE